MKLNELAIERTETHEALRIQPIHDRLNLVVSSTPSVFGVLGLTLREVLFGLEPHERSWREGSEGQWGELLVGNRRHQYRLSRSRSDSRRMLVEGLADAPSLMTSSDLLGPVDRYLFEGLYVVDLSLAAEQLQNWVVAYERRIRTEYRHPRFRTLQEYRSWKTAADGRRERLANSERERTRLETESRERLAAIDQLRTKQYSERSYLEGELAKAEQALAANRSQCSGLQTSLEVLDRQITELRALIAQRSQETERVPVDTSDRHPLILLYGWLDDVEGQIRRWRQVQNDIQTRRIALRDEMMVWNELTMEHPDHPYHRTRQMVTEMDAALQAGVARLETLREWEVSDENEPDAFLGEQSETLSGLQANLEALCEELGGQFKTIRHRVAVTEFKQLRLYFQEAEQNLEQLQQRRLFVLDLLRQWDATGAQAVVGDDAAFLKWAAREGYLSARRKFLGAEPASPFVEYRTIAPDLTREQRELEQLLSRRQGLRDDFTRLERERPTREQDLARWQMRLAQLGEGALADLLVRQSQVAEELDRLRAECERLTRDVAEDQTVPPFVQDDVLTRAVKHLHDWGIRTIREIRLAESTADLQWSANGVDFSHVTALDSHVLRCLWTALAVAGWEVMIRRGAETPALVDQLHRLGEPGLISRVLKTLSETGQQVLVLEDARHVSESWTIGLDPTHYRQLRVQYVPRHAPQTIAWSRLPYQDYFAQDLNWREQNRLAYQQPSLEPRVYCEPLELFVAPAEPSERTVVDTLTDRDGGDWNVSGGGRIPGITERTPLINVDLVDSIHLNQLTAAGVADIQSLLDLDPDHLPDGLSRLGISPGQIDRWQAQAWLMICLPGLVPSEARLLVACGVMEPEQLETTNTETLLTRINRYLASPDGQRLSHGATRFDVRRIERWYQALESTRRQWRRASGYSRRANRQQRAAADHESQSDRATVGGPRYFAEQRIRNYEPGMHYFDEDEEAGEPVPTSTSRTPAVDRTPSNRNAKAEREPSLPEFTDRDTGSDSVEGDRSRASARNPRWAVDRREPPRESRNGSPRDNSERIQRLSAAKLPQPERSPRSEKATGSQDASRDAEDLKFYLNLEDAIEAAPSIGPKTAERFTAIGIQTIRDFLKKNAEAIADDLNYKRISADVVRAWQNQTRLVCRVPNLRGHDAQLLVACGVEDPDELAGMNPSKLLAVVGPFADTKDGLKIVRSGKKPDLAEVTDWIRWAKHTRSLNAA